MLFLFLMSCSGEGIALRQLRQFPASSFVARQKLAGQRPTSAHCLTLSLISEMGRKSNLKLSLRGGGLEANSIQETEEFATIRRDLPSDVTCALTGKEPRAGGNLEEEDLDGPQSEKGDASEVTTATYRGRNNLVSPSKACAVLFDRGAAGG
jgi:hypothetical protein